MTLDICVPYWGEPATFIQTIDSVCAQTDPDWRLTIIDDGYPGTVIADYVERLGDARIRYRRNDPNVGITENFRRAVAAAEGSHVVVLGSDDLLRPDYVAHVSGVIQQFPDVDVIQPGVDVIDANGDSSRTLVDTVKLKLLTPRRPVTLHGEEMARSLLVGNWLYRPSLALRTETARRIGFRDGLPIILDLALLIDIALDGGSLRYTHVECFAYRRHAVSLSQTALQDGSRFTDERQFYRECVDRARRRGWPRAARGRSMAGHVAAPRAERTSARAHRGNDESRRATLSLAFGR